VRPRRLLPAAGLLLAALSAPFLAASAQPADPRAILGCGGMPDDAARLRCFDAALPAVRALLEGGPARPAVPPATPAAPADPVASFGAPARAESPLEEIEARVATVATVMYGQAAVTLDNGQVWRQTQSPEVPRSYVGKQVRVRRNAMGGFILYNPDGGPGYPVKRVK